MLDTGRELGVTLIAYQPRGLRRFMPFLQQEPAGVGRVWVAPRREIGARHGTSPTQVAIRWLIWNDSVLPIPGAKNGAQAVANAQALSLSLSPDSVPPVGCGCLWCGHRLQKCCRLGTSADVEGISTRFETTTV